MKAYIMIGAPGSGKSTWAKNAAEVNSDIVRLCPDEFRAKFGTGEADQSVSAQAFAATRYGMEQTLANGKSVIIDATSMYRKARQDFIDIARKYKAETIAVVFEADRDTLIDRNIKRGKEGGRVVPTDVIDRMLSRYERPTNNEFDQINYITKL